MSYQFIHYETYNAGEARSVINENMRITGFCPHVQNPKPPTYLYGNAEGLADTIDELKATTRKIVTQKTRSNEVKTFTRPIKDNEKICLFGVVSLGREWSEKNPRLSKECFESVIEKLKNDYGNQLKCVLHHDDEEHPHLHFLVVPDSLDLTKVCRATRAEKELDSSKKKETKKQRKEARLHALQDFQLEWHRDIFSNFGLSKEGPKRRRMSRVEWLAEKETLLDVAKSHQAVRDIKKNLAGVQAAMLSQNIKHKTDIDRMNLKAASIQKGLTASQKNEIKKEQAAHKVLSDVLGI